MFGVSRWLFNQVELLVTKMCCFPASGMDNTENALCQNRKLSEILKAQAMEKCGLYLMPFTLNVPGLYLLNNSLFNTTVFLKLLVTYGKNLFYKGQ